MNLLKTKRSDNRNNVSNLQLETLEDRTLLSGVQVFASGDVGGEQFALQIDGQTVQQFTVSQDLTTFDFQTDQAITADQVSIEFLNDQFDPAAGIDANLRVDAIEIDGVRFETETASVFSTGTFLDADGVTPGFGRGEVLHTNGTFQFASPGSNLLEVSARGDVGTETFNVIVAGEVLNTFTASTSQQSFFVPVAADNTAGDVRVEFVNDQFDPAAGIDSNLTVDFISINGEVVQAEGETVFSTGTFQDANGVVDGFGRGGILHTNGFLQFTNPLSEAIGEDRTIVVAAEGLQAINSEIVSDLDRVGAGAALILNDASGSVNLVNQGELVGLGQAAPTTVEAGDGVRLAGAGPFEGSIVNEGLLTSVSEQGAVSGFRAVNGLDFQGDLINRAGAVISGTNNAVYFGTGDNSGEFINEGVVISDSRALNIDGDGLTVVNSGAILGAGDQRNGTIYSDNTASNFEIVNTGLVDAGEGNDGAAISLSLNNDGSNGEVGVFNNGSIVGRGQTGAALATAGDGIRLEGNRVTDGIPPGLFQGSIVNTGAIVSESAQGATGGVRAVNDLSFQGELVNEGLISGVQNGVYFGTGDHNDGIIVNNGTISSDSRAINLDGSGLELVNSGSILGTGDQRNGTVYVDGPADNFDIVNLAGGLIDAGDGNNGSGVGIEVGDSVGDFVTASVSNAGVIQGRGTSDSGNTIGHGLRFIGGAGTEGTAVFAGDVVNTGGISGALQNGAAAGISIENVGLDGVIVNRGEITGAEVAIDASTAASSIRLVNEAVVRGDVLLGSSDDVVTVTERGSFSGVVDGGAGYDTLNIEFSNFDDGVVFVNSLDLENIERVNVNGQRV